MLTVLTVRPPALSCARRMPGCFDGCSGATEDINATRELWSFFRRIGGF